MKPSRIKELNYKHLYCFYMVEKNGGISKAAKEMKVSQPVVSSQIKELEKYLGFPLLEKDGRSVKSTKRGLDIFNYCEGIFFIGNKIFLERLI